MIVSFIPAAGRSSRMRGRDKLLEEVDGVPILRRTAATALEARLGPVIVGLGPGGGARREALDGLDIDIIDVTDASEGMAATLRAGARAALQAINADPGGSDDAQFGMLVLLPDMPGIEAADLIALDRAFEAEGGPVVRAVTEDGVAGHPVLFPARLLRDFAQLAGDKGAVSLLDGERVVEVALAGRRAVLDLDTPEDWDAWRSRTDVS